MNFIICAIYTIDFVKLFSVKAASESEGFG